MFHLASAATDQASNAEAPPSASEDSVTVDTVDPTGSITIDAGAAITNDTEVTLGVTSGDATSGVASTEASNDNSNFSTVSGSAPTWTLTSGDGLKTVWFRVTDNAGRSTTVSDTIELVSDTTPPAAPSIPDLDATSDTGASSTDDLTSDTTPTFVGTAEAGATVTLYDAGSPVGSGTATGGSWTITSSALTAGTHAITATATDAANNTSPASGALSVTIDTAAPAAPSTPDLDASSDTGGSSTDDTTSDATPTFSGTAESGATVTIYADGDPVGSGVASGGSWSITADPLGGGSHAVTAKATDLAGQTSAASAALTVIVDITPPSPVISSPTGSTSQASQDVDVVWTESDTGSAVATRSVQRERASAVDLAACATATFAPDGAAGSPTSPLSETDLPGETCYRWKVSLTDTAGLVATTTSGVVFVLSTAPPAPGAPDLDTPSDTSPVLGWDRIQESTDDLITGPVSGPSTRNQISPAIHSDRERMVEIEWTLNYADSTGSIASALECDDGTVAWTWVTTGQTRTVDWPTYATECWISTFSGTDDSYTVTGGTYTEYRRVTEYSAAGDPRSDHIRDVEPGVVPANGGNGVAITPVFDLALGKTSSISLDITTAAQPSLYLVCDGVQQNGYNSYGSGAGIVISRSHGPVGGGLTDCVWNLLAYGGPITINSGTYAYDDGVVGLYPDNSPYHFDDVTRDDTPSFSGTYTGTVTRVELYDGTTLVGTDAAPADGVWHITASARPDGERDFTVKAVNGSAVGPAGPVLSVVIDTTAPPAPGTPDLTAATDDGQSSSDDITSVRKPHLVGSATGFLSAVLRDGTTIVAVDDDTAAPDDPGPAPVSLAFPGSLGASNTNRLTPDFSAAPGDIVTIEIDESFSSGNVGMFCSTGNQNVWYDNPAAHSVVVFTASGGPCSIYSWPYNAAKTGGGDVVYPSGARSSEGLADDWYRLSPRFALEPGPRTITVVGYDLAGNASAPSSGNGIEIVAELVTLTAHELPPASVGEAVYVVATTHDETGQLREDYTGNVTVSADAGSGAVFPDGSTAALSAPAGKNGHAFKVLFGTTGTHTVTVAGPWTVPATYEVTVGGTTLEATAPATAYVGSPVVVTFRALDADSNPIPNSLPSNQAIRVRPSVAGSRPTGRSGWPVNAWPASRSR
jgi:hypothetical protein